MRQHIFDEQFDELAKAVFADDLAQAKTVLVQMRQIADPDLFDRIVRTERAAVPQPSELTNPLAKSELFPAHGHAPGSTISMPKLAKKPAKPKRRKTKVRRKRKVAA